MSRTPNRLLNEAFFSDSPQVRLHHQHLTETYELHWHEFYELTFILSGRGTNTVNGRPHALQAGDMFLLTPADFHEISPEGGTTLELYNLIFSQHMLPGEMAKLLFARDYGRYVHFSEQERYDGMVFRFKSILYDCHSNAPGREMALQSELTRILIDWHRCRAAVPSTSPHTSEGPARLKQDTVYHPGIQKAIIFIQHHFRQPISLEEAAEQAHLSPNYFSELFRKSTGTSFQQHLQQLRLQFAHALLSSSDLPVTEACYIAGFNTLTHFEKIFRQHYGITPRQAKKQRSFEPTCGAGKREAAPNCSGSSWHR
ncbi:helix-turn-helix domain-containing protein [Paenibacillus caseinilyticus]|uniref:AraC family transcriptional regulator n=1 Tax=Paenibacillus mucilaginosus K02 TaxID=997761 RepID=I0BFL7_9BACL|nr:AraC family transcriptional regulator [Paenibacillus mucilaginosus]AFH61164.1 AraC family transcriptional regulator [Paenibacillus mucilaginosus K02]